MKMTVSLQLTLQLAVPSHGFSTLSEAAEEDEVGEEEGVEELGEVVDILSGFGKGVLSIRPFELFRADP